MILRVVGLQALARCRCQKTRVGGEENQGGKIGGLKPGFGEQSRSKPKSRRLLEADNFREAFALRAEPRRTFQPFRNRFRRMRENRRRIWRIPPP